MNKIESLTVEQSDRLKTFRAEWLAYGISTAPADRKKAEAAILAMRNEIDVKQKPTFIWCASPATSLLAIHVLKSNAWEKMTKGLVEEIEGKSSLGSSLGGSLWSPLRGYLRSSLRSSLGSSLWSSLESSLESSLRSSLWSSSLKEELWSAWWGQYDSYWVAYYLFSRDILGVKYDVQQSRQLDMWRDISQSCGWWWCYENYVIISERPTVCGLNAQELIHSETGPAMAFSDGWNIFALNGVTVKEEHVMTPAEKLNPTECLKETNVDIRRELIRKIGVEMLLKHLPHKILDIQGDYQVLSIDFPGLVNDARYLKMLNPSIGVWHLEGVERICDTVQKALNWRAGTFGEVEWTPSQLT